MTDTSPIMDDDDDLLAAEYVMGLLPLDAWNAANDRERRDPGFAARVTEWTDRLADLNEDYAEAAAPNLLPQIEARLFPQAAPARRGFFSLFWAIGVMATAVLAFVAFTLLTPPAPSMVATLTTEAATLTYEARITGHDLTLTRVAGTDADTAHSYELWIIVGKDAPKSLGVITGPSVTISLADASAGAVLAITLEQPGGSPDGTPKGPIVAAGPLTTL